MTPQEAHRVAFDNDEQCTDEPEKHIEVHGHPLEPEVIINVKQEPQVNSSQKRFSLTICYSSRLNCILDCYCHYLKRLRGRDLHYLFM
jgi:hypothetical protein